MPTCLVFKQLVKATDPLVLGTSYMGHDYVPTAYNRLYSVSYCTTVKIRIIAPSPISALVTRAFYSGRIIKWAFFSFSPSFADFAL